MFRKFQIQKISVQVSESFLILNIMLSMLLFLSACSAQKPNSKPLTNAQQNFGPRNTDKDLNLRPGDGVKTAATLAQMKGNIKISDYFTYTQNLYEISKLKNDNSFEIAARKWVELYFQNSELHSFVAFKESPYVDAMIGFTQDEALNTAQDLAKSLDLDMKTIRQWLLHTQAKTQFPAVNSSMETTRDFLVQFMQNLADDVFQIGVAETFQTSIHEGLLTQVNNITSTLDFHIKQIREQQTLSNLILAIGFLMQDFDYTPNKDRLLMLEAGKKLGADIEAIADNRAAFVVLIDIWRLLTPEQRKIYIEPENKDLYEYLSERSEGDLDCLRNFKCFKFKLDFARSVILQKIDEMGVEVLKTKLQNGTMSYAVSEVQTTMAKMMPSITDQVWDEIQNGFQQNSKKLAQILQDYPGFVRQHADSWAKKQFSSRQGQILGLDRQNFSIQVKNGLPQLNLLDKTQTGAETLGTSMYPAELISSVKAVASDQILGILNKLLMIGGYKNVTGISDSLSLPIFKEKLGEKLNIFKVATTPTPFAVPNILTLMGPYKVQTNEPKLEFSVGSQASMLRGISKTMALFQDWKSSPYDSVLGNVVLGQVIEDMPESIRDRKIFPKDAMYALSVANGAVILNNLLKDLTPIFVLNEQSRIIWANEYDFSDSDVAAMAGVVDVMNGKRGDLVRSKDLANYILALKEFLQSTEGIEKTKSPSLTQKDEEGKTPIQRISESRSKISLLVLGLANFLSHQMTGEDGLVRPAYSLKTRSFENNQVSLSDQVLAIRALVAAYEFTKMPNYIWSAVDIYYAMNRGLYDGTRGLYRGMNTVSDLAEVMVGLAPLRDFLPEKSQVQFNQLNELFTQTLKSKINF